MRGERGEQEVFRFQKLDVWHKAVEFADFVYEKTRNFPSEERFGLTSQIRRAVVSVSSNIAEGSSRTSRRDFSRFIEIAYGSLMEVVSQIHIAHRQSFMQKSDFSAIIEKANELARMLSGFKAGLSKD